MALFRFSDLRGHRAPLAALQRLVARGLAGHAYLFEGPAGVGKDTVAQAFLARLACVGALAEAADACGLCRSCAALLRSEHPDMTRIAKDGASIKIDQVRDSLKRLRYEPTVGRIKGVLVESADLLREEAANALLKTLEEPPSATVFVLVTSKPQRLLDTIRSRCQALRFAELSLDDVAALLVAENVPADEARVAAALAQGSMHRARELCDPARMAVVDLVARFTLGLGTTPPSDAAGFVDALGAQVALVGATAEAAETETEASTAGATAPPSVAATPPGKVGREDLQGVIDVVRAVLRDALLVGAGQDPDTLPHARYAADLRRLAGRCDAGRLLEVVDACGRLEDRLTVNPNPRLALQALLVDAAQRMKA